MPSHEHEKYVFALLPTEEFNAESVLSVPQGFRGVIWKNAYDFEILSPGEYALSKYFPKEKKLFGGGKLHGKIAFVNTNLTYQVDWGTGQPVVYYDKKLDRATKVGFSGSFRVKVDFVEELVYYARNKALANLELRQMVQELSGEFVKALNPAIKNYIESKELDFSKIPAYISQISNAAEVGVRPLFSKIGLWTVDFAITGHVFPEHENN